LYYVDKLIGGFLKMDWNDLAEGGLGAVVGSILNALGMGYRLKNVEED
jgi:hypothetical protein